MTNGTVVADAIHGVLQGDPDDVELDLVSGMLTEFLLNQRMIVHLMLADRMRDAKGKLTQAVDPYTPAWGLLPSTTGINKKEETLEQFRARFNNIPTTDSRIPAGMNKRLRDAEKKVPAQPPLGKRI